MGRKRLDLSNLPATTAAPQLTEQQLVETTWRDRINRAHSQVQQAEAAALPYAREAGQALLEVKAGLEHGQFTPWLEQNVTVTARQARSYMAIAANWAVIEEYSKRNRASVLSIRAAMDVIRGDQQEQTPAALPAAEEARPQFTRWHSMTVGTDALERLQAAAGAQNRKPEDLAAELLEKAIAKWVN